MMPKNDDRTLAEAVASMVRTQDVAEMLSRVVAGCAAAYPSEAVAVMASDGDGTLELLCASSHNAEELELLQIQHEQGPCLDAMSSDTAVIAVGRESLVTRWGDVGAAIAAAGFDEVHAFPMHWRGVTIGGLNIFVRPDAVTDPSVGQLFADLATLAVLQSGDVSFDRLVARVHEAVAARTVIEQAKGVLAFRLSIDLETAYDELVSRARTSALGLGLGAIAEQVVADQHRAPTH